MSEIKNVISCGVFYYIIQKMRRFGQSLSKFFYNPDIQTVIKIQNREAHMITNETRTSIKKIYEILWDVMALYERTEMYNVLPEDREKTELDIWDFMGDKLLAVRKESMTAFLGKEELCSKMEQVIVLFGTDK